MKQQNLLRKNVRVIIPFKEEEVEQFIEIKNPKPYTVKVIKERLVKRINGEETFTDGEILEYLIKELTNVELEYSLDELLDQDISFECKMLIYHVTEIYHEIFQEMLVMMKLDLTEKKTRKMEEEVVLEMSQV